MVGWCHVIIKTNEFGPTEYQLCELFHDKEKVLGHSQPCDLTGDSVEDLKELYKQMASAFKGQVIRYDHKKKAYYIKGKKIPQGKW